MTSKRALIVDDSRAARVVLTRMLQTHELIVDTAESAETALEYLTDHRPDVIFMDHMMPGMDGFEAVRTIKQNPATATIPIMMYTSQEGELYVGQARALGAVGVLPKKIAPVEVSRVLKTLRLIPGASNEPSAASPPQTPSTDLAAAALNAEQHLDDERDLRDWIQELFEKQRSDIRRELVESYETIATRLADENALESSPEDPPATSVGLSAATTLTLGVMCLVTLAFGWLFWRAETERRLLETAVDELSTEQARLLADSLENARSTASGAGTDRAELEQRYRASLALASWAFNEGGRFDLNEMPLSDQLAGRLSGLVTRLDGVGFEGTVVVETHFGDFCTVIGPTGSPILADDVAPMSACEQLGIDAAVADRLSSQQSIEFANMVERVGYRTDNAIAIAVVSLANTRPTVAYPDPSVALAGEWNSAAAANQRIEVRLEYADPAP